MTTKIYTGAEARAWKHRATQAELDRAAALAHAEELTRALQEAREAIAAIARGDVPFCEECGNGETLAMQWDDEGNPVCDTHSGGIVCRRDVVGAGAIRAALTAVPTEAPRG